MEKVPVYSCSICPLPSRNAFVLLVALRSKYATKGMDGGASIAVMITSTLLADNVVPPLTPVLPLFVAEKSFAVPT